MAEDIREEEKQKMHPSFMGVIKERERIKQKLANIKHKIGIYSAKGGVGKTTISVNMAYALSKKGFKVGLLDADIDCPNLSLFLGINERMSTESFPLKPLEKDGVKVASTAMLVDDTVRPIIWRGPIIVKMLYDFFENTEWGDLDYMIIDLPPGTSDAPLTIMQVLDLDGFVIVTTPQKIASINSIRSGMMARRLNKAVLGVVENMAYEKSDGKMGGDYVAKELGTALLGRVPFDRIYSNLSDSGKVPVLESPEIYRLFDGIVEKMIGK